VIGQVNWPSYQAIGKVQPPNSVNPKPFGHGNTELNSTKVDKCVESIKGQPQVGYDVFRAYMKMYEPTGNKLVAQKCVVTELRNAHDGWRYWHDFIPGQMALLFSDG
jgi:hypothetical protein